MSEYHQDHDMMHLVLRLKSECFTRLVLLNSGVADNEDLICAALRGGFRDVNIVIDFFFYTFWVLGPNIAINKRIDVLV